MKQIVASARQMARYNPVEIFFLRAVVIGPIKKGNETHWMPTQRMDKRGGNLLLPVIVRDSFAEESTAIRGAQCFKGIGIQAGPTDAGKNRIEQVSR